MSYLSKIYAPWAGNAAALAADLGESDVTVRQWRNRGNIPPRYWRRIIVAAAGKGAELDLSDFVAPHSHACADADDVEDVHSPETRRAGAGQAEAQV